MTDEADQLTGVARRLAARVVTPSFDASVGRRIRRRRVRAAVAVCVGTALVIGGVSVASSGSSTAPTPPADPAPSPTPKQDLLPETADQVVESADATLTGFAMLPDGTALAVWRACAEGDCAAAYDLRGPGGDPYKRGMLRGGTWSIQAGGTGFLLRMGPSRELALAATGKLRPVAVFPVPDETTGDEVFMPVGDDGWLAVRPGEARAWRFSVPPRIPDPGSLEVDDTGRVWAMGDVDALSPSAHAEVAWSDDGGRTWAYHPAGGERSDALGLAVGPSGDVAAFSYGASRLDPGPLLLDATRDGGATWTSTPVDGAVFGLSGQDVTTSGRLITSVRNGVFRSDPDWTEMTRVAAAPSMEYVVSAGALLYGPLPGRTQVAVSADDGLTWQTYEPR